MQRRFSSFALVFLLTACATLSATVRYVKWDKPHSGNRAIVVALDLAARKTLWEVRG